MKCLIIFIESECKTENVVTVVGRGFVVENVTFWYPLPENFQIKFPAFQPFVKKRSVVVTKFIHIRLNWQRWSYAYIKPANGRLAVTREIQFENTECVNQWKLNRKWTALDLYECSKLFVYSLGDLCSVKSCLWFWSFLSAFSAARISMEPRVGVMSDRWRSSTNRKRCDLLCYVYQTNTLLYGCCWKGRMLTNMSFRGMFLIFLFFCTHHFGRDVDLTSGVIPLLNKFRLLLKFIMLKMTRCKSDSILFLQETQKCFYVDCSLKFSKSGYYIWYCCKQCRHNTQFLRF